MADPRFFARSGPFSLRALAGIAGAEIADDAGADAVFEDVAPLDAAGPATVSFLDNRRYVGQFTTSAAGACLVHPDLAARAPAGMALLVTREPYRGYARVAQAFYPDVVPGAGVDPTARLGADARLGAGVRVEAGAVVGDGAEIGERTWIRANAVLGAGVVVGADCRIGPAASLSHCRLGDRVVVHAGARIGQDGFGFAPHRDGHLKVPQLGRVIVEDDVDIGANTTIDRGAGPDTVIGRGTKIDNLVQIGHNVRIGAGCILVGQVGVSGSCTVGDYVMMGGQVGLAGHLTIGAGAQIGAKAGVMRDVEAGDTVFGAPAVTARAFWRQVAALARLAGAKEGKT